MTIAERCYSCHRISEGIAEGEVIISKDDIMFYLVNPETGVVIEKGHDLEGRSIAGKILVFPGGKGSSVVQADGLYQLAMKQNAPKAMIIQNPDTVLVASAIIMEVPMVDQLNDEFYANLTDGCMLRLNADTETIEMI